MIHEGTHGIQAADLLGRKVRMEEGRGLTLLAGRAMDTVNRAEKHTQLAGFADALTEALLRSDAVTRAAWSTENASEALANAVPYLQAFGHTVLAWIWLDVACAALAADPALAQVKTTGVLGATQYFFHYELPKVGAWHAVVESRDMTCANMAVEAF